MTARQPRAGIPFARADRTKRVHGQAQPGAAEEPEKRRRAGEDRFGRRGVRVIGEQIHRSAKGRFAFLKGVHVTPSVIRRLEVPHRMFARSGAVAAGHDHQGGAAGHQESEADKRGGPEGGEGIAEQHGRNRSGEAWNGRMTCPNAIGQAACRYMGCMSQPHLRRQAGLPVPVVRHPADRGRTGVCALLWLILRR